MPFAIEDIKNINKAIKVFNIIGINVTIPYKKKIIKYLDELDVKAKKLEAVNTILNINGKLKGYNTDVYGFEKGLKSFKTWNKKKPVIVIGAGGAAESIVYSLIEKSCKNIYVMNRTLSKAKKLENKYSSIISAKWLSYDIINEASLIINTTSLGMIGCPNLSINLQNASKDLKVYDIVYNPQNTDLIKEAKKRNLDHITGLSMFLGQAEKSFKIWFKKSPLIDKKLLKIIKKQLNIK